MGDAEMTMKWERDLTERIAQAIKVKELNLKQAFRIMDYDGDFEISIKDFQYSVQKILNIRITDDELLLYWRKIPIALENMSYDEFVQRFHKYLDVDTGQYRNDLSYINNRILGHTTDLEGKYGELA